MPDRAAPRPLLLLCAIFVLSIPLLVLGSLSSARLMPGLPLSALMFLCTAAVAAWAAWRVHGLAGVRALLARLFDARRARPWTWHLVSVSLFPGVLLIEYAIMLALRVPVPAAHVAWRQAPVLFALFFVAAACEEVAWSATLLEPLQMRYGALGAGLVLGAFTAAWHVIPFWQANPDFYWVLGQCVFTVGFRVVVAWIYNVGGRSLFAAVLCHAGYNTAWQLFPNQGSGYNPWITAALTWAVVAVVVVVYGARTLAGRHPASA
jgi:membrane protease YdiL (CAAX protease family)